MTKEEYIKKHGVSEKEFLYYCINCLDNEFIRDGDNINDLKGFLYDLVVDHFKLKEKYEKILDDVHDYRYETHAMKMTIRNLCEHFGVKDEKELQKIYLNKPYTFEDLKENMWVWDDKEKSCYQIGIDEDTKEWVYYFFDDGLFDTQFACPLEFEENRFYPVQKANEK